MNAPARYQPISPAPRTDLSQATAIEQSRAVAEVQAAVFVAQQRPRNKAAAVEEMRDATAQMAVAEKAYFRYRRGTENVTGVSVHLARELARCWGNIDYGLKELRRDDTKGESEMLAHAWDMQTNARASTTFIVPHVRDTRQGSKRLTETRDIYENNANAGARRLREQILAVLPNWFVEEAKSNCDATLDSGGGRPLVQRIADAIRLFDELGVNTTRLEAKLGRSSNDWTGRDVGQLGTIYNSIKRGETTIDNEFDAAPAESGISAEDVATAGRAKRTPAEPVSDSGAKPDNSQAETSAEPNRPSAWAEDHIKALTAAMRAEGLRSRRAQLADLSNRFGREITDPVQLTADEVDAYTRELIVKQHDRAAAEAQAAEQAVTKATPEEVKAVIDALIREKYETDEEQLDWVRAAMRDPGLSSIADLTSGQATEIVAFLAEPESAEAGQLPLEGGAEQ
ncbi:hypothetical protein [Nocardia wallacei]|uniref:hypothetical protein n=1 Tax=Nocardia wallacei TaxID=480035 RepID=UPI002456DEB1|nr:hypothetical protein [Nocardia wallacei]